MFLKEPQPNGRVSGTVGFVPETKQALEISSAWHGKI